MKITAIPSVVSSVDAGNPTPSHVESVRTLRMNTNATPLTNQFPIGDTNTPAASVEATQPLSPQLALLSKQRRALQVRERELEIKRKALESQSTGSAGIDVSRLKSEPLRVLLENGVTYDQLTEAILANQGNSELDTLKAEIASLKQGLDQKFIDRDAHAEKQVLAEMRREADLLVKSDDYELVRETNRVPDVMKLIERTYKETGEVLDVSEALGLVEAELLKDAQKLAGLKKLQPQMSPLTPQQPQQRPSGMRTLTNRDTASVPLSAKQRAMAAFYGTLPGR